jgi:hypothetical protein
MKTGRELPYKTLQESWEAFAADVLSDATESQRRAMRNAFFVGASTTWLLVFKAIHAPGKTQRTALLQALFEELDEFIVDEVFAMAVSPKGNA